MAALLVGSALHGLSQRQHCCFAGHHFLYSAKGEIQDRTMAGSPRSRGSTLISRPATQPIPWSTIHCHISYAFLDHCPRAFAELCDSRFAFLSVHQIHLISHHQLAVFGVCSIRKQVRRLHPEPVPHSVHLPGHFLSHQTQSLHFSGNQQPKNHHPWLLPRLGRADC